MSELPRFPTSLVGSLPRPRWLIQVLRDRDQGNVPDIEWQMLAEHAVRDAVQIQKSAGLDVMSDGEQRRDGFLSFVQERVFGIRRMTLSERLRSEPEPDQLESRLAQLDVPISAIKSPVVSDAVRVLNPYKGMVLEEVDYLHQQTTLPIRVALPGPYTLSRALWSRAHSQRVYASADDLALALLDLLREEVAQLAHRGVFILQIDEPALAGLSGHDPDAAFVGAFLPTMTDLERERASAVELINVLTADVSGLQTSLHASVACWTRSNAVSHSVDLDGLAPLLESMNVSQLALALDDPEDSELQTLGRLARSKSVSLGVVRARSDAVESPEEIVERVQRALAVIPPEQIWLTPDTGFAPFAERNLNTTETAAAKLTSLVEAARRLRLIYGHQP